MDALKKIGLCFLGLLTTSMLHTAVKISHGTKTTHLKCVENITPEINAEPRNLVLIVEEWNWLHFTAENSGIISFRGDWISDYYYFNDDGEYLNLVENNNFLGRYTLYNDSFNLTEPSFSGQCERFNPALI